MQTILKFGSIEWAKIDNDKMLLRLNGKPETLSRNLTGQGKSTTEGQAQQLLFIAYRSIYQYKKPRGA